MRTRESDMPDEPVWASFFRPERVLSRLGLTGDCRDVVEFGCGYGTFTVPAAQIVRGVVHALDIDPAMIAVTQRKVQEAGLSNVVTHQCDFEQSDVGVPDGSADYAMLFNILHAEQPELLLRRAKQVLRPDGVLAIMHWNYDPSTPRGPSMDIRPRPTQCRDWAASVGFELMLPGIVDLPPYHYGMALRSV